MSPLHASPTDPYSFYNGQLLSVLTGLAVIVGIIFFTGSWLLWMIRSNWRTYRISMLLVFMMQAADVLLALSFLRRFLGEDYPGRAAIALAVMVLMDILAILTFREFIHIIRSKDTLEDLIAKMRRSRRKQPDPEISALVAPHEHAKKSSPPPTA